MNSYLTLILQLEGIVCVTFVGVIFEQFGAKIFCLIIAAIGVLSFVVCRKFFASLFAAMPELIACRKDQCKFEG